MELFEVFKALGDNTRLRILSLLEREELCVCMIAEAMDATQPTVSKHLNRMRVTGIIECRRISQWCFYRITADFRARFGALLEMLRREWETDGQYAKDVCKIEQLHAANICCQQTLCQRN